MLKAPGILATLQDSWRLKCCRSPAAEENAVNKCIDLRQLSIIYMETEFSIENITP